MNKFILTNGSIYGTILNMVKYEKRFEKMRNNPKNWTIDDFKIIAKRYGVFFRQPGTSHVTFRFQNGEKVTIPAHKRIKPVYVKQFIKLIDEIGDENE